jgi:hypothetical protein
MTMVQMAKVDLVRTLKVSNYAEDILLFKIDAQEPKVNE